MTNGARITKQIIILVVFLLIIGGIGFGAYAVFKPPNITPTPDPTINLTPISVLSSQMLNIENNDYDFLAKVSNPNFDYGSDDVEYSISFFGASGNQVSTITGSFYILPGQSKYIINSPLKFSEQVARAEMSVKSVDWLKMDPQAVNDITFLTKNYSYNLSSDPGVFSKVGGQILNNSNYDLSQVSVLAILFDETDKPIAVGKTEILTFLAKTTRGFETAWYTPFVGQVNREEIEVYTNVFDNSNFIRDYGGTEKFQQYY